MFESCLRNFSLQPVGFQQVAFLLCDAGRFVDSWILIIKKSNNRVHG